MKNFVPGSIANKPICASKQKYEHSCVLVLNGEGAGEITHLGPVNLNLRVKGLMAGFSDVLPLKPYLIRCVYFFT